MNDPDRPDGSELQLEALLLYHTIQLQSLEDVLEKVCFAANAKFGGKTYRVYGGIVKEVQE